MANSSTTQREPNTKGHLLPSGIVVGVFHDGKRLGAITLEQGKFLSEKGNVSYSAAITARAGLQLPGNDPKAAITGLSFTAQVVDGDQTVGDEVPLTVSNSGVHEAGRGKVKDSDKFRDTAITVTHIAPLGLPVKGSDDVLDYVVTVRPEYLQGKGAFTLTTQCVVKAIGGGNAGPAIRGAVDGLVCLNV
jgi:hypothetical protein